jgi:hypothetical protein
MDLKIFFRQLFLGKNTGTFGLKKIPFLYKNLYISGLGAATEVAEGSN